MDFKKIMRWARRASEEEVRALYFEVYGAYFSGPVTVERARASIEEACREMLERGKLDPSQYHTTGDEIMAKQEITLETILTEMREMSAALTQKIMDMDATLNVLARKLIDATPEKPAKAKKEKEPKEEKPGTVMMVPEGPKGEAKLVEVPTLEVMREVATKYSAAFGMNDLISAFKRLGAAKLSDVVEENRALLLRELRERLEKENGKKATEVIDAPKTITLDDVKPKAKAFLDKNGKEALAGLLKAFGAGKLSEVPAEKLTAFAEALDNA